MNKKTFENEKEIWQIRAKIDDPIHAAKIPSLKRIDNFFPKQNGDLGLYLQVGVAVVGSGGVDSVLVGDDLPELGTDLVATLASLEVDDFSHSGSEEFWTV